MTVIVVEGESDRAALTVLAARMGVLSPPIMPVGGAGGVRRAVARMPRETIIGLVDANERTQFETLLDRVFVCDPDLEGELIRALGVDGVERVIAEQGELPSFRLLQRQPAQRERSTEAQLARFFGGRSGNKVRYATLLAAAVPLERVPEPLVGILREAGLTPDRASPAG